MDKLDIAKLQTAHTNWNNFKSHVDKLDLDKIQTVSIDLQKLSYVADNDTLSKTLYNSLVSKDISIEATTLSTPRLLASRNMVMRRKKC